MTIYCNVILNCTINYLNDGISCLYTYMYIIIKKSYLYLHTDIKEILNLRSRYNVKSSVIESKLQRSLLSQHHGMTVIIGGFHVSLLLIACGTNSELSCSAISGLRRLFRSPSLSLRLESIDGFSTTVEDARRRTEAYFVIMATASTSVRNTKNRDRPQPCYAG